jgi:hypothetical protein
METYLKMDSNKIINMSAVSKLLSGNSSTVRSTRNSPTFSPVVKELTDFVDAWSAKYSKSTSGV